MNFRGIVVLLTVTILGISYGVYQVNAVKSTKSAAYYYNGRQKAFDEINKFFDEQNKLSGKKEERL